MLSVFSLVLAAPVLVREVPQACANAMEGDDNVIIVSEKRAKLETIEEESDLYPPEETDLYPPHLSDTESGTPPPSPPHSPSASVDASGNHPGVGMPSSPPAGSTSPLSSKVLSTPGGTETKMEPPSSSGPRPGISWDPVTKVQFADEPILKFPKKSFYRKIKSFFSKVGGKLSFRPRSQRTVDTGA
jgi:hypothetical protein